MAKKTESKRDEENSKEIIEEDVEQPVIHRRRSPGWVLLLGIVVIYLGALVLGLIPANFLSQLLHTLTEWTRGFGL